MDRDGLVRKVRGGAETRIKQLRKDISRPLRLYTNEDEKNRIGHTAAQMIHSNSIVGLDGGVTIQIMANFITNVRNVTFVTHSFPIATILADKLFSKEITGRLIFIGGEVDVESRYTCGALTMDALKDFNFDQVFVSCSALSAQGVSDYKTEGSLLSSYLIKRGIQTILLAEKEKLGKNSLYQFAELTELDYIVLDDPASVPTELRKALDKSSTELVFATR